MASSTDPLDTPSPPDRGPRPGTDKRLSDRQALIILAFAFLIVFLGWRTLGRAKDHVAWAQDVQAVMDQARATNKPVLMNFTADWCAACQELKARIFSRRDVAEQISQLALPLKVDLTTPTPATDDLCRRYQILATPTLLLLAPDGREISRRVGVIDSADLIDWLAQSRG
ncbi:MAG: thioredoxin family protein [Phycisphaeraceae bacterium]|nr:thioredoxin family protein [Phycisphaeraceae bacterium]